jgi:hypothetical protein
MLGWNILGLQVDLWMHQAKHDKHLPKVEGMIVTASLNPRPFFAIRLLIDELALLLSKQLPRMLG